VDAAGDPRARFAGKGDHVDFAADAELAGEVDAGFDGEAGVGQDEADVVGFEVVEVRAAAVDLGADVVAGAVGEEFGEAGGADDVAGGVVCLPAGDGRGGGVGCSMAAMAASRASRTVVKMRLLAVGGLAGDDAGPGDVVVDGVAGGWGSLAQMSMRTKSPGRMGREFSGVGS
jgi:hypothetical protein